jgi:hypothetical protein
MEKGDKSYGKGECFIYDFIIEKLEGIQQRGKENELHQ